jgi:CheY-like chemotaxis protein
MSRSAAGVSAELILLVEDNADDVLFVERAFRKVAPRFRLEVVRDGAAAIHYLTGTCPYNDRTAFPLPRLILLDLQMPRMDGFQFLDWLRKQPSFESLPVVILAGATITPDVQRAYQAGANSFVTKPLDPSVLSVELKNTLEYWVPMTTPPTEAGGGPSVECRA